MACIRSLFYGTIESPRNGVTRYMDVGRVSRFYYMYKAAYFHLHWTNSYPYGILCGEHSFCIQYEYKSSCLVSEPTILSSLLDKPRVLIWLYPRSTSVGLPAAAASPRVLPRRIMSQWKFSSRGKRLLWAITTSRPQTTVTANLLVRYFITFPIKERETPIIPCISMDAQRWRDPLEGKITFSNCSRW